MRLEAPPAAACWQHRGLRTGFEVAFFDASNAGSRLRGHTTASESGRPWSVGYDIELDRSWRTVLVHATATTEHGEITRTLVQDEASGWVVDGVSRPELDGCVDVDFESSAVTNTLPLHRLDFSSASTADVPAVFVRADDLRVERLEQRYTLRGAAPGRLMFRYESSTFGFACDIEYDLAGIIVEYPGIAQRVG